jgi:hypothetical protein
MERGPHNHSLVAGCQVSMSKGFSVDGKILKGGGVWQTHDSPSFFSIWGSSISDPMGVGLAYAG